MHPVLYMYQLSQIDVICYSSIVYCTHCVICLPQQCWIFKLLARLAFSAVIANQHELRPLPIEFD
jgi:hypothetical protein